MLQRSVVILWWRIVAGAGGVNGEWANGRMGERSNDRRLPILTGRRADAIRRSMLFCSQAFLLFFLAVFAIYWAMPWQRPRIWLLLVASFCFYASWNKWLALL